MLASVFSASFLLVRRTDSGLKYALSNTMTVVPSATSDRAPPMTPAMATGRSASAITSMSGGELARLAVERLDRFAGRRRPHADLRAGELREVERVHRLSHLEQHVVGDVDDVADGTDAGGLQPRLHPRGRGPDRHVRDRAGVSRAEIGILDDDVDVRLVDGLQRCQAQLPSECVPIARSAARTPGPPQPAAELKAVGGRDLARHTHDRTCSRADSPVTSKSMTASPSPSCF